MFPEDFDKDVALYFSTRYNHDLKPVKSIGEVETINDNTTINNGVTFKGEIKIDRFKLKSIFKHITYHPRFLINKEKRTLFLQYYDRKIVIKCHKDDKFDWKIGLGLALSNAIAINPKKAQNHRNVWFRNKKTHKLKYKEYANWVLTEFYNNNMEDLYNLEQRVKEAKDKEFIEL